MKLLTKKEVDQLLARLATCQIIANNYIEDIEAYDKITENLADVVVTIGGEKGVDKVIRTLERGNEYDQNLSR